MKYKQFLMLGMASLAGLAWAQQTEHSGPQKIERTEAIAMGNLIDVVPPQYPDEARKQHSTGKVVLKILVDSEGKVKEASLLTGDPLLADATVAAVKQWKFRPYLLNNEHVEVETTATVEYTSDPPYVVTPKPLRGPRKIGVSQGVMERNLIRKVEPEYPPTAKAAHVQGDVVLDVVISKEGSVENMQAKSGHPILIQAALDAVKQWTYKPMTIQGDPVEVETTIVVRFHM